MFEFSMHQYWVLNHTVVTMNHLLNWQVQYIVCIADTSAKSCDIMHFLGFKSYNHASLLTPFIMWGSFTLCSRCYVKTISISSSSFFLGLDGLHQRDPARHSLSSSFSLTQVRPHLASDVHRAVVLVGLWGDLHLLDDELQEVVLLLQQARHLLHPREENICSRGT